MLIRVSSTEGVEGTTGTVYEILVRGAMSEKLASGLGARSFEPRRGKR